MQEKKSTVIHMSVECVCVCVCVCAHVRYLHLEEMRVNDMYGVANGTPHIELD